MAKKPTYEELEQRVKELEKEAVGRKQAEEVLRESERHLRAKVDYIFSPEGVVENVTLSDLLDLENLQEIQDSFAEANRVASLITDVDGNPITKPSNFCGVCQVIRKTEKGSERCIESDRVLGEKARKFVTPIYQKCLSCGFASASAPIIVAGKHIANWLIGQGNALDVDRRRIEEYAHEIGASVAEMLAAYDTMPRMSLEQFEKALDLLWHFAKEISTLGYNNLKLARDIVERKQAEDALRESEERYRSLVESTEDSIYLLDRGSRYLFMNEKCLSRFGLPIDKVMGRTYSEFHSEDETKKFEKKVKEVFKASESLQYEYRSERDGRYFLRTLSPVKEQGGRVTALTVVSKDITARKQVEEAFKESEEKYRTLSEQSADAIYTTTQEDKFSYINQSFLDLFGYTKEELEDLKAQDTYVNSEDRSRFQQEIEKTSSVRDFEVKLRKKDGTEIDCLITSNVRQAYDGSILGYQGIIRDITERKSTEESLKESEEKYRTILESIEDGYYEVDIAGSFTFFNDSICKILGYTNDELMGMNNRQYTEKENAKKLYQTFNRVYKTGKPTKIFDWEIIRKDGTKGHVETSVSIMKDSEGNPTGFRGIVRDITEKKSLQAQLQYAQRMESIGTLAGGIAHNFNNLLMSIQGNASLMLIDTNSDHPHYERLTNIEKMVQSGSKLTSQLLGYARGGRYEVKPISFNQIVKDTSNTFDITKKDITVHQDLDKDLSGIKADQGQIEQVLLNLYVNAADAMPQGGDLFLKTMNVTHEDMKDKPYTPKPGNYALLTVRDTGVGMDKKTLDRIFDPFFTKKGLAKGTGLGLASVYGIVKAHGGYIDVESKKGHGATFYIYLPATKAEGIAQRAESERRVEILQGKETVLLVDDEEMILDVGQELLKTLGYKVLIAEGGKEAIDIISKGHRAKRMEQEEKESASPVRTGPGWTGGPSAMRFAIDLVILDMIMPVMGGGETYDRIKEINPNIKVLLSSGYSINGQATEILQRGCNGFIQKPFTMKELSKAIREALGKR